MAEFVWQQFYKKDPKQLFELVVFHHAVFKTTRDGIRLASFI